MLSAAQLLQLEGEVIFHQTLDKQVLRVFENTQYRWFTLGGDVVQAIMAKAQPEAILLAIPQALMMFVLWQSKAKTVLNLGLGAGGLERALTHHHDFNITAVEQQAKIITMAQHYFNLPDKVQVIADTAESFLAKTHHSFDVILCDIYQHERTPQALFHSKFYLNLSKKLTPTGCALVSINSNAEQLTSLLTILRSLHLHVSLIDFNDYKNIVVLISKAPLPNKTQLMTFNQQQASSLNMDFLPYIERTHAVPAAK